MTRSTLGLREMIYAGELKPGERVHEANLGARLGVSRTPLRISLSTLAHEGLVEPLEGGGFIVRSFTREEAFDAIELRGVLEGTAARLAAERLATEDELSGLAATCAALDRTVASMSGEDDLADYIDLNRRFHDELTTLARNDALKRAVVNVTALPFASVGALLASHAVLPEAQEILVIAQYQHRALLEAIGAGQGTRAEELGREHSHLARRNLELALDHSDAVERIHGGALLEVGA